MLSGTACSLLHRPVAPKRAGGGPLLHRVGGFEHPEALELLDRASWKEQWVKRICDFAFRIPRSDFVASRLCAFARAVLVRVFLAKTPGVVPLKVSLVSFRDTSRLCVSALEQIVEEAKTMANAETKRRKEDSYLISAAGLSAKRRICFITAQLSSWPSPAFIAASIICL